LVNPRPYPGLCLYIGAGPKKISGGSQVRAEDWGKTNTAWCQARFTLSSLIDREAVFQNGGRVEPGGHPPGTPTDPDVPNFRTAGTRLPVPLVKVSLNNKLIRFRYPPLFR
jgi:hypothetical protein